MRVLAYDATLERKVIERSTTVLFLITGSMFSTALWLALNATLAWTITVVPRFERLTVVTHATIRKYDRETAPSAMKV